jgi:hypothetical protein
LVGEAVEEGGAENGGSTFGVVVVEAPKVEGGSTGDGELLVDDEPNRNRRPSRPGSSPRLGRPRAPRVKTPEATKVIPTIFRVPGRIADLLVGTLAAGLGTPAGHIEMTR